MEIEAEESGFERAHIPEGIHHAELVSISDAPDGQYGPRVALDFRVFYSKTEQPVQIGRVFGKKLTPKSKLWEAFEALTSDVKVGTRIETDTLIGKPCRVVVEDMSDNEGKTISVISRVKAPDEETVAFIAATKQGQDRNPVSVEEI
ncbi:MAG: hypothetical protein U5L00_07380 [Desulfovermiculus sp.]|nr:hypothetical protein [Desulfovermiculus sp.]